MVFCFVAFISNSNEYMEKTILKLFERFGIDIRKYRAISFYTVGHMAGKF
jgi:hypothetical protein